ncbi:MAG: cell division protein SepF [Clostridia bacterium]|nr:cell division protein SepF [Clostridia bacterium]
MGVFDLFGREPRTKKEDRTATKKFNDGLAGEINDKKGPVSVFSPTSFSDVEIIIDAIRAGKNAVVHLTELKTETAVRVLDMLSGAIYALGGGVYEMGKNVFMFSPSGVEVY